MHSSTWPAPEDPVEQAEARPRLDAVVIAYRSPELLRRCLQSLRTHPPAGGVRTVIVDNAADAGTRALVTDDFPECRYLASGSNVGFGVAANAGAASGSAPYLAILNPDVAVRPATLDRLIAVLEQGPRVGCVGPALHREDGSFDHAARRSFPTPVSAFGHFSGMGRRLGGGALADYRAPWVERGATDAINGAFMVLRREAFESIGGFDPGYWMYMEDLDLNWRLREAGWETHYEPAARALHTKAGTTGGKRTAKLEIYFHRGMGRFYRAHYAGRRGAVYDLGIYLGIGVKLLVSLARRRLS